MNQFFLVNQIEFKYALVIIGIVIVGLTLLYLIFRHFKYKKAAKKLAKKTDKYIGLSTNLVTVMNERISESPHYKGTFKSLSSKAKKSVKKYLKSWIKYVPFYCTVSHQASDHKYKRLYIGTTKEFNEKPNFVKSWHWNPKKNDKVNIKKLIKFMNKNKNAKAVIEVITHVFEDEKNNVEAANRFNSFENNYFVQYVIRKKK